MKTILIIDDDPLIRKTLAAHFSSEEDYEITLAEDGREGLQKYEENSPDLVILDIRLPDINGLEVLRKIKEINEKAHIIIITAYDDMKTTVEAIKSGAFE